MKIFYVEMTYFDRDDNLQTDRHLIAAEDYVDAMNYVANAVEEAYLVSVDCAMWSDNDFPVELTDEQAKEIRRMGYEKDALGESR